MSKSKGNAVPWDKYHAQFYDAGENAYEEQSSNHRKRTREDEADNMVSAGLPEKSNIVVKDPFNETVLVSSASDEQQRSSPQEMAAAAAPMPSVTRPARASSLFQKASGGQVHISDEARNRAARFLTSNTISSTSTSSAVVTAPMQATSSPSSSSSSTARTSSLLQKASGKSVVISDASKQRAQQWLAGDGNENHNPASNPPQQQELVPRTSNLLTKASGKAVVISDEARAKAAQLLNNNSLDHAPMPPPPIPVVTVTPKMSSLLQRVDGKGVVVSDEAGQKAKSMLQSAASSASLSVLTPAAHGHVMITPAHPNRIMTSSNSNTVNKQSAAMENPTAAQLTTTVSSTAAAVAVVTVERNNHLHSTATAVQSFTIAPQPETVARRLQFPTPDLTRQSLLAEPISLESIQHVEISNHLKKRLQILNKITSSNVLLILEQVGVHPADILQQIKANYNENMSAFINFQLLWISWTIVSYERRSPELYLGQLLTDEELATVLQARCEQFQAFDKQRQQVQPTSSNHNCSRMIGKTHLSSLQRSSEIMLLENPLCVCVMLSLSLRGVDSLTTANSLFESSIMVTDGWFQIEAKLDPMAMELIRSNKIRDGTKLCIFTAQFVNEGTNSKVFIALTINGIRRANTYTKLGILPSQSLSRGLSIHSLTDNGGAIYALRGIILKFMTRYQVTGPQSEKGLKAKKPLFMTEREAQEFMEHVEKQLQQQAAVHEQRLHMAMNEDDIEQEQDELDDLMQIVQRFTVQKQIDMLIRCAISSNLAWVRLPAAAESEESEMDLSNVVGKTVLITNLIISKRSKSKLMQLIATRSSSWRLLQQEQTQAADAHFDRNNQAVIIDDGSHDVKINLRNSALLGSELTKQLHLIDINTITESSSSSSSKQGLAIHEQASIQVFAVDDNYLCYRLSFDCYAALVHRYVKLQVGSSFMVEFAAIGTYDHALDVLQLHQNDRTAIQLLSSQSSSSRSRMNSAVMSIAKPGTVLMCQEEQSRVKSLQTLQASFSSIALPHMHFDCRRLGMDKVSLLPSTRYTLNDEYRCVNVTPVKLTMIVEEHSQLNRELQTSLPWLFNEETFCMELVNTAVLHFGSEIPQIESSLQSILLQQITVYDADRNVNPALQAHLRVGAQSEEKQSSECEEINVNELLQSLSFIVLLISNH